MDKLIEALQIFIKYENHQFPTTCEHDTFWVCIDPELVSKEDIVLLENLGFNADYGIGSFSSFHYGSC